MKHRIRRFAAAGLQLAAALVLLGCIAGIGAAGCRAIPAAARLYEPDGLGVTLKEVSQVRGAAAAAFLDGTVQGGPAEETAFVQLAVTSGDYGGASALEFAAGGYFSPQAAAKGQRYAVLEEPLALELFGVSGGVGEQVQIGGSRYTVCGVWRRSGFFSRLAAGQKPVVYVSLPPSGTLADAQVQQVLLPLDGASSARMQAASLQSALSTQFSSALYDLSNWRLMLGAMPGIAAALCGAWIVCALLAAGGRRLVQAYDRSPDGLRAVGRTLTGTLPFLVGGFVLLAVLLSGIQLPGAWLPPERFLDLSHYRELLVQTVQAANASGLSIDSLRTGLCHFAGQLLLLPLAVVLFWQGCAGMAAGRVVNAKKRSFQPEKSGENSASADDLRIPVWTSTVKPFFGSCFQKPANPHEY